MGTLESRTPKTRGKNSKATLSALDRANWRVNPDKPKKPFATLKLIRKKRQLEAELKKKK
jgi:hypothetical protein